VRLLSNPMRGKRNRQPKEQWCVLYPFLCIVYLKNYRICNPFSIFTITYILKIILFVVSFKQTDELKITRVFWLYTLLRLTKSVIDFICFFVYIKVGRILKHFLLTFGILLRCTPEMCFFSEIEIFKKFLETELVRYPPPSV
jgi:hypothetical protein